MKTFRIDAENLEKFTKKLNFLTNKAKKLGCNAVGFRNLGEGLEFHCAVNGCPRVSDTLPVCRGHVRVGGDWANFRDWHNVNDAVHAVKVWKYVEVEVFGEAPKFDGWTFAATLERLVDERDGKQLLGGVNLVRSILDGVDLPEHFRTEPPKCDHCKLSRYRKDTFVMMHEDGRFVQVGRQCIKDFLGHNSPENIAALAQFLAELEGELDEDEFGGYGARVFADELDVVLAFAVREVAENGYRPKSSGVPPFTSENVHDMVHPTPDLIKAKGRPAPPTDEELEKARAIIAYFAALEPKSDFEHNVSAIARAGIVGAKHYGYAVSLVCAYERAMGREAVRKAERAARAASDFFGEVGKRETFKLTVTKVIDFDGAYGTQHLHLFADEVGNVAKWMTNSQRLEVGTTYEVKATVKKHDEYKGTKQTVLSRCKATEAPVEGAA